MQPDEILSTYQHELIFGKEVVVDGFAYKIADENAGTFLFRKSTGTDWERISDEIFPIIVAP